MPVKSAPSRHKDQLIAADILYRIQQGEWRKGMKIPSVDQLAEAYPYARMTVFKAVEFLTAEGYLEVRRGVGTFVARDRLLGTIGLVIGEEVLHPQQTPMAFLLAQGLRRQLERLGYRFKLYIDTSQGTPAIPHELRDDLAARRLAGLITVSCDTTLALPDWPGWEELNLPYVDITAHDIDAPQILMDRARRNRLFIRCCAELGLRRAGTLMGHESDRDGLRRFGAEHGVELRPEWILDHADSDDCQDYERHGFDLMQTLWACPERPEALLVCDDIACKGVVQAVLQLGIEIPERLVLVTQANRNSGVFYPVPTHRIEYDIEEGARLATDLLLDQINDPSVRPASVVQQPRFDSDTLPQATIDAINA